MTSKSVDLKLAKGARRRRPPFATIDEALAAITDGRMIIVVDDEDRENEGDLTMPASTVTPEAINFMVKHGRGLVCLAMTPERLDALEIPLEVTDNSSQRETAMCVSIDAKHGTSTGISAADRARTVEVAIDPSAQPRDLARPGHVFPLRARPGGVLVRAGHTEAAVDLSRIAGLDGHAGSDQFHGETRARARVRCHDARPARRPGNSARGHGQLVAA